MSTSIDYNQTKMPEKKSKCVATHRIVYEEVVRHSRAGVKYLKYKPKIVKI